MRAFLFLVLTVFLFSCASKTSRYTTQNFDQEKISFLATKSKLFSTTTVARAPAGIVSSCGEIIGSIFSSSAKKHDIRLRRERSRLLREHLQNRDAESALEVLRKSHDAENDRFVLGEMRLRGRTAKRDSRLARLRRSTKSLFVPAFFQTKVYQNEDVLSTIVHVTNGNRNLTEVEELAIADVWKWINEYKGYWSRMEEAVYDAIEADELAEQAKNFEQDGDRVYPTTIKFTYTGRDGNPIEDEIYFDSIEDLINYREEKERIYNIIFAANIADETFRKSRTYQIMYEHGLNTRRLELVYNRLMKDGVQKLGDEQRELLEEIRRVVETDFDDELGVPLLRSREDINELIQEREIRAERFAKWRFWKSKRVEKDAKYPLPDAIKQQVESLSPSALITRYMGISVGISVVLGGGAVVTLPLEEMPQVQYFFAYLANMRNDFVYWLLDTNEALVDCAKADRTWTHEALTLSAFIEAHTSRFNYLNRFTDKDWNLDPELEARKDELAKICELKRAEYRMAEVKRRNVERIPKARRFALHDIFMQLFIEKYPGQFEDEGGSKAVLDLLDTEYTYQEEPEKLEPFYSAIADINPEAATELRNYMAQVPEAMKVFDEYGSIPKANNVADFLEFMGIPYDERGLEGGE